MPRGALRRTPAWGALLVSFFVGAALIAALIDIPIFARTTVYPDSQLSAALVLVRFLVALPVGAVAGGYLTRRLPAGVVTAVGMALAAAGFVLMTRWDVTTLAHAGRQPRPRSSAASASGSPWPRSTPPCSPAPTTTVHGLASAGVVVARMVGMLVGISALTTIGLRRYYAETADLPPVRSGLRRHDQLRRLQRPAACRRHRPGARRLRRGGRSAPSSPPSWPSSCSGGGCHPLAALPRSRVHG